MLCLYDIVTWQLNIKNVSEVNMNIFNKTFLALSLALVIPLSTQAHWLSSLRNQAPILRNLTNSILNKKKTIAASIALSGALSYGSVKLVQWFYSTWPNPLSNEEMLALHPGLDAGILFAAAKGFKQMNQTILSAKTTAITASLALSIRLMCNAHKRNLFGENS